MAKQKTPEAAPSGEITNQPPAATPPPAPAAEQAPPAEKKDITDAMREESRGDALDAVLGLPAKTKEKPAAAAAPKVEPEPAAKPAPAAEAQPPAEAAKPVPVKIRQTPKPQVGITKEDAAQIAASTVAEFTRQQAAARPQEQAEDALPDDLKRMAPLYSEMERLFPDKYKPGTAQRIAKFRDAELQRADKWEAEHPGSVYNAEDDEHADFYSKHQPKIDPEDIDEARFEVRYKSRIQRDIEPQIQEAQRTTQYLRSEPEARTVAESAGTELVALMLPEGSKATPDVIKEWAEKDPITAEVATEVAKNVKPVVYAMSLLWDGVQKFDERNEAHTAARQLLTSFESELSAQDPEALADQAGRPWVPLAQYAKLDARQQQQVFTTTKEHLARFAAIKASQFAKNSAKQRVEIAESYAKRMGYSKADASVVAQQAVQQQSNPPVKINSPSIGAGNPTPPSAGAAKSGGAPATDPMARMLGL